MYTQTYIEQQQRMHAEHRYGDKNARKWVHPVLLLAKKYCANSVLDYGCGTGVLRSGMLNELGKNDNLLIREYDPGVLGKHELPSKGADLVTCIDVLEHVEPEFLDQVLRHLRSLTNGVLFAVAACRPAGKILPDGRNAHLIVEPWMWWRERLWNAGFDEVKFYIDRCPDEYCAELT